MGQRLSAQSKSIHKYLGQGVSAKDIAKKLKISRQVVYNVQYQLRKREQAKAGVSGIASVKPTLGGSGTGITSLPSRNKSATKPEPVQAKRTLWQRVKDYLFPNY